MEYLYGIFLWNIATEYLSQIFEILVFLKKLKSVVNIVHLFRHFKISRPDTWTQLYVRDRPLSNVPAGDPILNIGRVSNEGNEVTPPQGSPKSSEKEPCEQGNLTSNFQEIWTENKIVRCPNQIDDINSGIPSLTMDVAACTRLAFRRERSISLKFPDKLAHSPITACTDKQIKIKKPKATKCNTKTKVKSSKIVAKKGRSNIVAKKKGPRSKPLTCRSTGRDRLLCDTMQTWMISSLMLTKLKLVLNHTPSAVWQVQSNNCVPTQLHLHRSKRHKMKVIHHHILEKIVCKPILTFIAQVH